MGVEAGKVRRSEGIQNCVSRVLQMTSESPGNDAVAAAPTNRIWTVPNETELIEQENSIIMNGVIGAFL